MEFSTDYLDYDQSEAAAAGYHARNVALDGFITVALQHNTPNTLDFKPAEQPGGYVLTKQKIDELLKDGGDSLALLFAIKDVQLGTGLGHRKDLTVILKPFNIENSATLPFKKNVVTTMGENGKPNDVMISSNTMILSTRCCPPSDNLANGPVSECVSKLLRSESLS